MPRESRLNYLMSHISVTFLCKIFFVVYVFFTMTTLKFTLGLTAISSIFNSLLCLLALIVSLHGMAHSKFGLRTSILLVLTISFCFSCFINLFLHWSLIGMVQVISHLLSWIALIMVISNKEISLGNYKLHWSWFNNFIVIICFIGLCEYLAIYSLGYRPPIMEMDTGMGKYYVGYSTMLQKFDDLDIPYFRFQGPFGESGDLAMWASVLMVYNFLRRQYLYAIILVLSIFGAFSPSVFISLFIAFLVFMWTRSLIAMPIVFLMACLVAGIFINEIIDIYNTTVEIKIRSVGDRFNATKDFIDNSSLLINSYPFGIPFFESANEKIASGLGTSASYGPMGSYEIGGVIAFIAHFVILIYGFLISSYKILISKNSLLENELYMYYLMLFTYIVQRASLFDIAIIPFLFAPLFFDKIKMKIFSNKHEKSLIN